MKGHMLGALHDLARHEAAFQVLCQGNNLDADEDTRRAFIDGKLIVTASAGFGGEYKTMVGWKLGPRLAERRWSSHRQQATF